MSQNLPRTPEFDPFTLPITRRQKPLTRLSAWVGQEELDFPDEWFFAADEGPHGTLYLMPSSPADAAANFSHPTPGKAITVVATRHQRVVQALGEEGRPVKDVKIEGVTIAHAEATYLGRYEIPSGGDWAISRSAAVFFDGVETSAITGRPSSPPAQCPVDVPVSNSNCFSPPSFSSSFLSRFAQLRRAAMRPG